MTNTNSSCLYLEQANIQLGQLADRVYLQVHSRTSLSRCAMLLHGSAGIVIKHARAQLPDSIKRPCTSCC